MGLHWADYILMVVFLCASISIGIYHALTGGKQKTTEEFIMGNRNQSVIPTALSLVVSYLSALLIIGATAEMYTWGSHMSIVITVSYTLGVLIAERLALPWLYPLKLTSICEYFEIRFASKTVRIVASVIGIAWGVLYMGSAIFAPSIALETATGFPLYASIPIMSAVCIVYTAAGGMKAVVWTDVFQFLVMMAGMSAILIKGSMAVGGLVEAFNSCGDGGRLSWYSLDPNPTTRTTTWGIFGITIHFTYQYGFQQAAFQRYSATVTLMKSRVIMWLVLPFISLMFFISYVTGLFVFAYYNNLECDPLESGQITNANELLGLFVNDLFSNHHGFMGFFLATLYSGSLSSVSSSLSGVAANTWEDLLKWKFHYWSDYKATLANKVLVIIYGLIAAGIAFLAAKMPGPVSQICDAFLGAASGPLMGMFLLGGIFKFVEWIGVTVGGLVSFLISLWICIMGAQVFDRHNTPLPPAPVNGCDLLNYSVPIIWSERNNQTDISMISNDPIKGIEHLYAISFLWYSPLGAAMCIVVGLIVSFIAGRCYKVPVPPEHAMICWRDLIGCNSHKGKIYKSVSTVNQKNEMNMTDMNS